MRSEIYLLFIIFAVFQWSCQDVIDIQPDSAPTQIVIDAWINDLSETQVIRITESQPYFENSFASAVVGASVTITGQGGQVYNFADQNDGNYTWTPSGDQNFGQMGETYTLTVDVNGKSYFATSRMQPTTSVDSIVQEFRTDEIGGPDGIYLQFFARDLPGLGNTYWIKTFKNGYFLNKPEEINLAFDGGFDAGAEIDGIIFIPPIRELVNPFPDSAEVDLPRWDPGDEVRVEIHSITLDAFLFLESARDQILNGSNTIFASPIANSPGNIRTDEGGPEPLGVFCISAVATRSMTLE